MRKAASSTARSRPPGRRRARSIRLPRRRRSRAPEDLASQEAEFRRRQTQKREAEEKLARQAKLREARCDEARDRLEVAGRARIYRREQGEKVYLSDAERATQIERLRGLVTRYCR